MQDIELTTPKTLRLLSNSTDRAELIALRVCVCCRSQRAMDGGIHCYGCGRRLSQADQRAFSGYLGEIDRLG